MVMNISNKFEKSTYNTLASRGVTRKSLHTLAVVAYSCIIVSTGCYPVDTITQLLQGLHNILTL